MAGVGGCACVVSLRQRHQRGGATRALAKSPYLNNITQLRLDWYDWQDDAATMKILRDRFGDAVSRLNAITSRCCSPCW